MSEQRKLTIVANKPTWDQLLESQFVCDTVFGGLDRPVVYKIVEPDEDLPIQDDLLIVNLGNYLTGYVRQVIESGRKNIGVLAWCHTRTEDYSYYPSVDYVLRTYFSHPHMELPPDCRCQDIAWIPNGYRSGVGPRRLDLLPKFKDRPFEFFYSGFPNTNFIERTQMISIVQSSNLPSKLVISDGFSVGLSIHHYRTSMENTRFALIPGGANAETIRMFEALELGAIPISLAHDFLLDDRAMGKAPMVRLSSWTELPDWYHMVSAAPNFDTVMEEFRWSISNWWQDFKRHEQQKVADVINRSFARS